MSGKGRGAPPVHRALHIASFFTRQGAPTSGETTAATVVDIDPRPRGPGRPPKKHPQQGETAAHEEAEEEEQLSELLEPAAQPVTSRKGKRRAPAEEEDQQLEPSRARKGNSDGQWRVQEKYGLTPNMMALYMSGRAHLHPLQLPLR